MNLPSDIWRLIISICKIRNIKNLCLLDKSFNFLCSERNLWLDKFKEKNLEIIDDDINTIDQYINEYKKVSYATYTTNCLINMIEIRGFSIDHHVCWFSPFFLINDLVNILPKEHPIFIKIKENDNIGKYISIDIIIGDKGNICYDLYNENNKTSVMIEILNEIHNDKNIMISLIIKIFYYRPFININCFNDYPIVISKNTKFDSNDRYINVIDKRKKYWDECYSKYEDLYF